MKFSDPVTLQGKHASLVPLGMAHHDGLCDAVRDGELWKLWYTSIPSPTAMAKEIKRRLGLQKLGSMNPFCILDAKGNPIGMTTFMNIDQENRRLEIGSTWYRKSVQRTAINTECKLMLLRYAFTKLDCIAVEFRTHFFNHQSRRGIERLGAKLDGILRSHQINRHPDAKESIRDTCVYSILVGEFFHTTYALRLLNYFSMGIDNRHNMLEHSGITKNLNYGFKTNAIHVATTYSNFNFFHYSMVFKTVRLFGLVSVILFNEIVQQTYSYTYSTFRAVSIYLVLVGWSSNVNVNPWIICEVL